MLTKLENFISFNVIPLLTADNNAPNVYITHLNYLNWRELKKSINKTAHYLHGTCIDIGSGNSPYKSYVIPHVTRYIAIDKTLTHQHMFQDSKVEYMDADVMALPFEDNSIDSVLLTQVLEHLDTPYKALDEIYRVMKPNAILILSVPFIYQAHATPFDYFRYSEYGLKKIAKDYNFKTVEFHYQGYFGTAIISMLNGFIWSLLSRYKLLRNTLLLPVILIIFTINNLIGRLLDTLKMKEFSPNFWLVLKK